MIIPSLPLDAHCAHEGMVKALIRKTVRLYVADRLVQFGQASRPW